MKAKKLIVILITLLLILCMSINSFACMGVWMRCNKDRTYKDSETHKYGLLWQYTCNVQLYSATHTEFCIWCYEIYRTDGGPHDCVEYHNDCGTENYSICPCEF